MQQRSSHILYNYWNEVRGDRFAPRRFDIEPAQLGPVLSETFILECDNTQNAQFRLAGTRICDSFGREFRGNSFLDLFQLGDRDTLIEHLGTLRVQGAVVVAEAEAIVPDRGSVRFEIVVLPLVHTGTSINRMLGAITAIDPPVWLGTERLPALNILRYELIWPEGQPHANVDCFRNPPALIPELADARLVRVDRRSFRVVQGGLHDE